VTVLTLERAAYEVTDPNLEAQIPAEVRVVRTKALNVKRHLSLGGAYPAVLATPDRWIGWWPWAVAAGRRILKTDPPEVIYSTSPHATAHLVALALVRGSGARWVADFRDPWYEQPPEPGTPWLTHVAARHLERRVIRMADRIVASTARLRDALAARYRGERQDKFVVIPNGYDEEDFAALPAGSASGDHFLILHAGSINSGFRDPRPLFLAIREAVQAGALDPTRVRLRFLGGGPFGNSREIRQTLERTGLAGQTEFLPRVSYEESLRELTRATVLLLLQASPDTVDLVPAKLFEYLRAGRPVLAVVKEGATAEVIKQVGGGWAVDPEDGVSLREVVVAAYRAWRRGTLGDVKVDPVALRRFSRKQLAGELAAEFNALCESPRPHQAS
jgi:glycosyltransferase involved in cell wall biosynthesis